MASEYGSLGIDVYGNTKPLEQQVAKAATSAGQKAGAEIGGHLSSGMAKLKPIAANVGKSLVTGLGLATTAAVAFGVKAYKAAEESNKVTAQTAAVIKSTGGAANVSAGQVNKYAAAIMAQTGISGRSVRSGENMLLTFRNIRNEQGKGNDIFRQSTSVLTDMTAAMNGGNVTQENMRKQAIQLGKALNDPVKGISALSRVGVAFTDQQKAQITALTQSGNRLGAQKIILAELNKEFAGSAAASTTWTERIKTAYGAITTTIGKTLVDALDPAFKGLGKLASSFAAAAGPGGKLEPIIHAIGEVIGRLAAPLTMVTAKFGGFIKGLDPAKIQQIAGFIVKLGPALAAAGAGAAVFAGAGLADKIPVIGGLVSNLLGPLKSLGGVLSNLGGPWKILIGGFALLMAVSPAFRAEVMKIARVLLAGLAPAFVEMGKSLLVLAPVLVHLARVLGPVLAVALQATLPLIEAFTALIRFLAPALGPIAVAILAIVAAVKVWAAIQAILDIELSPFTLVLVGLIAVVTGLGLVVYEVIKHWRLFENVFKAIVHGIASYLTTTWNGIKIAVTAIWRWVVSFTTAEWRGWAIIIRTVVTAVTGFLRTTLDGWKIAIGAVWRWITQQTRAVWTGWQIIIRNSVGAAVGFVRSGFSLIRGLIASALSKATSAITAWGSSLVALGRSAVSSLLSGISAAIAGIGSWIKAHVVDPVVNAVKHWFGIHSPSSVMAEVGHNVTAGFIEGIVSANPISIAKKVFGGLPAALGGLLGKGLVAIEALPGKAISALASLGGKLGGILGKVGGFFGGLFGGGGSPGVAHWSGLVSAVLSMLGLPGSYLGPWLAQMATESGGNPNAINLTDSNAQAGTPSQGLLQTIPATFAAYAGPFAKRGITDPLANIYAAINYALHRYGRAGMLGVIGHGHGYAQGGILREPVAGIGLDSGQRYAFGENAPRVPEMWSPLRGQAPQLGGSATAVVINVYPQHGQSETEIAAAVSRRLSWAEATGMA
jgi:hypothetical protein